MKGAEVGGVRAGAPACLPGPPLMMSTAGVTCYQQDRRSDRRLSITTPPPTIARSPITIAHYRPKRGNASWKQLLLSTLKDIFRKIQIEHKMENRF